MSKYAENTTTSVGASEQEIKRTLKRYQAEQIAIWTDDQGRGVVMFGMHGRTVRLTVEVPPLNRFVYDSNGRWRNEQKQKAARNQEERRRWRVLLLRLKARLEAVAGEDASFDEEFLPFLVTGSGETVAESLIPHMDDVVRTGDILPHLMPGAATRALPG